VNADDDDALLREYLARRLPASTLAEDDARILAEG
jgi:hypothetical protein